MKSSISLINAIKGFEGLRLSSYKCPKGWWTIGYGHTSGVTESQTISRHQAEKLLKEDIESCEMEVESLGLTLTQGQYDALVDFVFNIGFGSLCASTLLRKIRSGAPTEEIQSEFKRWVYSGTTRLPGLVRRREWEAERYAER
jgi:lysozyme